MRISDGKPVSKTMVVLIYPKTTPHPFTVSTPLSIFAIGSYLEKKGVEVFYFDERLQAPRELDSALRKKPEIVGVSAMTGYQIKRGLALSRLVRSYDSRTKIVWGGIHPTILPRQTLENPHIDFVVKGDGEETLHELHGSLSRGDADFGHIPGLAWKRDGVVHENGERAPLDVNTLPSPYGSEKIVRLIPQYARINWKGNRGEYAVGYEITRGCSYACNFCYDSLPGRRKLVRTRSKQLYRADLENLRRMGIDRVYFYDDNLAVNERFVEDFTSVMRSLNIRWRGCFRANMINERTLPFLNDSNCEELFFGIEGIDDEILRKLTKGQNLRHILRCIGLMSQSRIRPSYSFMCGFPLDPPENIGGMLDFIDDHIAGADPRAEVAIQPYNPLPGTSLYRAALSKGFQPPRFLEDWWRYTTGNIVGPWVRSPGILKSIFLTTHMLFRARYASETGLLSLLGRIARIRWAGRFFRLPVERFLFIILQYGYLFRDNAILWGARLRRRISRLADIRKDIAPLTDWKSPPGVLAEPK